MRFVHIPTLPAACAAARAGLRRYSGFFVQIWCMRPGAPQSWRQVAEFALKIGYDNRGIFLLCIKTMKGKVINPPNNPFSSKGILIEPIDALGVASFIAALG